MTHRKTALVLLSGGPDSVTALWWARSRYRVATVAFATAATPRAERRAARIAARRAGVAFHVEIPLPFLQSMRTRRPQGYLPKRNLIYYSVAASVAERLGADLLVGGHLRTDGLDFADARPSYFGAIEKLVEIPIKLPFLRHSKAQMLAYARRIGAPIDATWSCYRDGARPCAKCVGCRERDEAFRKAGRP